MWNGLRSRELTPYVNKAAAGRRIYMYAEREDMHTRQGRDSIDVCAQAVCLLLHFFYVSERSLVLLGFSRREDGEITTTRATSALL